MCLSSEWVPQSNYYTMRTCMWDLSPDRLTPRTQKTTFSVQLSLVSIQTTAPELAPVVAAYPPLSALRQPVPSSPDWSPFLGNIHEQRRKGQREDEIE